MIEMKRKDETIDWAQLLISKVIMVKMRDFRQLKTIETVFEFRHHTRQ